MIHHESELSKLDATKEGNYVDILSLDKAFSG
jgi:hypothetical protein